VDQADHNLDLPYVFLTIFLPLIPCIFVVSLTLHHISYTDTSGTCSMLPRDKGGVVDPRLKVNNIIKLPAHG
jgi:hypothetical protein